MQTILHFSCTHCAPQTGQTIWVVSISAARLSSVMSSGVETSLFINDCLLSGERFLDFARNDKRVVIESSPND